MPGADSRAISEPTSAALIDYYKAPGKYELRLRQPGLLFRSIPEILQMAAGRGAIAAAAGAQRDSLRDAARFFVRVAMLYPGADHYSLFGYASGNETADLKERYRLLMRLTHPDYAHEGEDSWPTDAAVRVNRGYEVLSSPVLRREYDDQISRLKQQQPSVHGKRSARPAAASRQPARLHGAPGVTKNSALLLGALAALPAILLLLPLSEQSPLVQRQHPARPRAAPPLERLAEPPTEEVRSVPAAAPAGGVDRSMHAEPLPTASTPARGELQPPNPQLRLVPAMSALPVPSRRAPDATDRPVRMVGAERTRAPMLSPAAIPPLETSPSHTEAALLPAQGASQPPLAAPLALAAPSASSIIIAPAAAPAPPGATATRVLAPKQGPAAAAPTLADAQPEITRLLHTMESGSGDQLLLLLQQDARNAPGAQALSRQYDRLAQGARPVRMSHADFTSRARDGVLIVTGRVRLHAGEATIGPTTQTLSWSAEFAQRDGRVQLINLTRLPD